MNILVTGADGFVASNLLRILPRKYNVVALDKITTDIPINSNNYNEFVNFDLSKGDIPVGEKLDLIIHLATVNQLAISANRKLATVNVSATHNILELTKKTGARLIFSSSCSVYGSGTNMKETDPLNPQSLYGIGKCYEEQLIDFYNKHYGVDSCVLRFSNCYGDTTNISNKVYPGKKDVTRLFMENMLEDKPLPVISGMGRDYTYIEDVIDALLCMTFSEVNGTFNVATGIETATEELAMIIGNSFGKSRVPVVTTPRRETDNIIIRSLNIDKISPYWKPKTSLKDGVKKYATKICLIDLRS